MLAASKYADVPADRPDSSRQDWSPANTPVKEPRRGMLDSKYADPQPAETKAATPLASPDIVQPQSQILEEPAGLDSGTPSAPKDAETTLIDLSEPSNEQASTTEPSTEPPTGPSTDIQPKGGDARVQLPVTPTQVSAAAPESSTRTAVNGVLSPTPDSGATGKKETSTETSTGTNNAVPNTLTEGKLSPALAPKTQGESARSPTERIGSPKPQRSLAKSPLPMETSTAPLTAVPDRIATPSGIQRTDSRASNSSTGKIKRLSKKGKPCVIRLPKDDGSKLYSGSPMPMSTDTFLERLKDFERVGYDTRGYEHWNEVEDSLKEDIGGRSRADYPSAEDQKEEIDQQQNKPVIAIPEKRKWDDYVNLLMEQKLKLLGVDHPPEPASEPDVDALEQADAFQQVTSPFPIHSLSPPLPTSSAASQKMFQNILPFSAPFSPVSTNNTSIPGIASPVGNQSVSEALSRQQSGYGFVFPPPQVNHQAQPVMTPQGMFNNQTSMRGTPSASVLPQRQPSVLSQSHDPFVETQSTPRGQYSELNLTGQPSSEMLHFSNSQQNDSQDGRGGYFDAKVNESAAPATPDNKETSLRTSGSYGDLAYPTPRGHRHNISANLEREAEAAQYYPGEYVIENTVNSQEELKMENTASAGSQENAVDSLRGFSKWKPGHSTMPSIASNASSSKLNVEAKEFKFDPTKAHSKKYSVSKTAFLPDMSQPAKIDPLHPYLSLTNATAHKGLTSQSTFNVEAPSFQPPMAQAVFSLPTSGFNFSAARPRDSESREGSVQPEEDGVDKKDSNDSPKIFSQINLADIVRPPRQSKAIPIVNPADLKEDDLQDDADGRITQSDSRRKRGRRNADDGDQVPLFASPTPEPASVKKATPSPNEYQFASPILPSTSSDQAAPALPEKHDEKKTPFELEARPGSADLPWHGIEDETRKQSPLPSSKPDEVREVSRSPPVSRDRPPHVDKQPDDEASLEDINAVMEQLNDNSDFGIEQASPVKDQPTLTTDQNQKLTLSTQSSVNQDQKPVQSWNSANSKDDQSLLNIGTPVGSRHDQTDMRSDQSPVRKLNKFGDAPISDWDDMLPSGEELIIPSHHSQPVDSNVATLVEGLLRRHLDSFEKQLKDVGSAVKKISGRATSRGPRPMSAYDQSDSDADDEEETDIEAQRRPPEVKSDRNIEKIRAAVVEAMSSRADGLVQIEQEVKFRKAAETRAEETQHLLTLAEKEIALFKEQAEQNEEKIQNLEEERKESKRRNAIVEEELRSKTLHFTSEVASLENTVDEYRSSSAKWKDEIDSARKSREALSGTIENMRKEAAEHHRTRDALDQKLKRMEEEMTSVANNMGSERSIWEKKDKDLVKRYEILRLQNGDVTKRYEDLLKKHEFLQARDEDLSKRYEILQVRNQEDAKIRSKLEIEIAELHEQEKEAIRTAVTLEETLNTKDRLEESISKLKEDTIQKEKIASEYQRALTETKEKTSTEVQRTRTLLEAAVKVSNQETENVRAELGTRLEILRAELEHSRNELDANKKRHDTLAEENARYQKKLMLDVNERHQGTLDEEREKFESSLKDLAEHHERAFREHKELSQKTLDEERAKSQSTISELHSQHERTLSEMKQTHENRLEEEISRAKKNIEDLTAQHDRALNNANEDKRRSETHLTESLSLLNSKIEDLSSQHVRSLDNAVEDKQRSESYLNDCLSLANSRIEHLLDKITHLEDKVNVAQSAAQAAAQSAKLAKTNVGPATAATATIAPSARSEQFEKVSPQALRESIVVLQEQLQQRESRIESLEQELSEVDKEAPAKLSERDSEIVWLRELLGVRVDDLSELINTLSKHDFNRLAARDAAIRIRANLQMEQQERERYLTSGKPGGVDLGALRKGSPGAALPSLTDIQNFASPKAAQLAAAWGNWRKGKDSPSLQSLREAVNSGPPSSRRAVSTASNRRESAGKANAAHDGPGFLSGLMTPPASNARRPTPTPSSASSTVVMPPTSNRPQTPRRSSSSSSRPGTQGSPTAARNISRSPTSMRATSLQLQRQQSWGQQGPSHRRNSSSGKSRAVPSQPEVLPPSPPLLSSGGYDRDAEDHNGIYEVEEEEEEEEDARPETEPEKVIEDTRLVPLGEELASAFPASGSNDEEALIDDDEEEHISEAEAEAEADTEAEAVQS